MIPSDLGDSKGISVDFRVILFVEKMIRLMSLADNRRRACRITGIVEFYMILLGGNNE